MRPLNPRVRRWLVGIAIACLAFELVYVVAARVLLRGDTDFSQTQHLDRWNEQKVQFVFGYDAHKTLVLRAEALPEASWARLERVAHYEVKTEPRAPRDNVKAAIIEQKEYLNYYLVKEDLAEFDYQPTACETSAAVPKQ